MKSWPGLAGVWVAAVLACAATVGAAPPRTVRVDGQRFVLADTNTTIVLSGPNVVVKGPPYLPSVQGTTICEDDVGSSCQPFGNCTSCTTFNEADVAHLKSMGWNSIRLGVVWAGAQPRDENKLDPGFLQRLHALLDLTDKAGIAVVLDNHGDAVGSANCGNGIPMWFSTKASPELIGKPLVSALPYSLIPGVNVKTSPGYSHCGGDPEKYAEHAGDPNYNLLNECCLAINGGNPPSNAFSTVAQASMDAVVNEGWGRQDFVRFWRLMAEAVSSHPSAFAAELMNEPMTIKRDKAYETWRACAEAIWTVIPDMAVSLLDTGETPVLPPFLSKLPGGGSVDLSKAIVDWIKGSGNLFYAWHFYEPDSEVKGAIENIRAIMTDWNVPSYMTESMSCAIWNATQAAGISHSYWHYSAYCTTGESFGNRSVPEDTFGACILGWASGHSSFCDQQPT